MTFPRVLLVIALAAAVAGAQQAPRTGKLEIPAHKSGKVVMKDGSPLPEPVLVEAHCGGRFEPVARTDSRGGFALGQGRGSDVDARANSRVPMGPSEPATGNKYVGCTLIARLQGYQSTNLVVTDAGAFDIGTIVLSRPDGIEGTMFSATSLKAPKQAKKSFEKAKSAIDKQKWDNAKPELEKAVQAYPEYAEAWLELGRIHQRAGDLAQARKALERSVECDPKFVKPYLTLAGVFQKEQNWQATADTTAKVIALDPFSFRPAYLINGVANVRIGKLDVAETSVRKALELDPAQPMPEAEYALALILDTKGDAKGAIEHLRNFLRLAPDSPGAEGVKQRLAELEKAK